MHPRTHILFVYFDFRVSFFVLARVPEAGPSGSYSLVGIVLLGLLVVWAFLFVLVCPCPLAGSISTVTPLSCSRLIGIARAFFPWLRWVRVIHLFRYWRAGRVCPRVYPYTYATSIPHSVDLSSKSPKRQSGLAGNDTWRSTSVLAQIN